MFVLAQGRTLLAIVRTSNATRDDAALDESPPRQDATAALDQGAHHHRHGTRGEWRQVGALRVERNRPATNEVQQRTMPAISKTCLSSGTCGAEA